MPDLHRPGYENSPYREAVNFQYDVHNSFFQTRIGNDSDLIHFFKSSGPELEDALLACLNGADDTMKIEVLKAASTLSASGDARFTLAALDLLGDSNADVRQAVRYVYEGGQRGVLNLDPSTAPDPRLVGKVVESLNQAIRIARPWCCRWSPALPQNSAWEKQASVRQALESKLQEEPRPNNYAQVLAAGSSFSSLMRKPKLQLQFLEVLDYFLPDVQRAALRICFEHLLNDPQSEKAVQAAFAKMNESALRSLVDLADNPQFLKKRLGVSGGAISQDQDYLNGYTGLRAKEPLEYPIVVDTIMARLLSPDANLSAAALDTLRKVKGIEQRADFRAAMNKLQTPPIRGSS